MRCLNREQRNYFNMLYSGIIQVIEDMCREGPYQTDYLRHAPCMSAPEVQAEYQQCSGQYQTRLRMVQQETRKSSEEEVRLLCCSFQAGLNSLQLGLKVCPFIPNFTKY